MPRSSNSCLQTAVHSHAPPQRPRPGQRYLGPLISRLACLAQTIAALALALPFQARATNHQLRMEEVLAGFNGDPTAQFIVMFVNGDGQKSWGPQAGEGQSRAVLEFFNSAGIRTGVFQIPNDPPPGRDTVLLATTAFAERSGLQPDIFIPPLISPGSGKVCFRGNPQNPNRFDVTLCLSYGSFPAALTEGAGSPAPGLPVAGEGRALRRFQNFGFGDETSQNADFRLAVPHPTNTAGESFVFSVAGPGISIAPETVRFGSQDVGATGALKIVTLRNFGTSNTLVLSNVVVGGPHGSDFRIVQDTGQTNLPPLLTRTLRVQFVAGGTGARSGVLRVTSNDPDTPLLSLPLQGHGLSTDPCDAPDLAGAAARDHCEDAMLVGPNIPYVDRIFGAEHDGLSNCTPIPFPDSPDADVYYRYVAGESGDLFINLNTRELGFNPNQGGLVTLSVHRACPAAPENEINCTTGFPEPSLGINVAQGEEIFIRISAVDGQHGILLTPTGTFELTLQGPPAFNFDRNRNGRLDSCEFDFGDAPAPYPTLAAQNGPRHAALSGLFLGRQIDPDNDGQPSARATGDNLDGSANDDDGVTLLTALVPGRSASVSLTASRPGLVNAWLDFNADGDWDDAGEQIAANRAVVSGTNTLTFAVPAGIQPNPTFARFRLSSSANLTPTGPAMDGEVEDYAFEIESDIGPFPGDLGVRFNEILAGLNGDSTVQFIELQVADDSEKAWGPQPGESAGRAMLVFSDTTGRITGRFVFPSNAPAGADTVLVATREFAQQTGLEPDFFMPAELMAVCGQVGFFPNPSNSVFSVGLALSYGGGSFVGHTFGSGPPNSSELPILDARSLGRVAEVPFGANINQAFQLGAPSPRNTKGQTVTLGARSLVEQGRVLFSRETFNGNGRTCQTCHLPGRDQFGLTPQTIASLPPDDPLFVFEANVNLMRLAHWSQPSDLRGTISGDTGNARIIGGSGDTFLVLGGTNLTGQVHDTNGNSGTLLSVTPGDLSGPTASNGSQRGLEDGVKMRSGRALILENIDAFARREVFRSSPHLLNLRLTAPYGLSGEFDNLRDFSDGAVVQHFPRSLARTSDVDFRHPTPAELVAMEAFMNAIVHPTNAPPALEDLDHFVTTEAQKRGRALFFSDSGKCFKCHSGPAFSQSDGSLTGSVEGVNESFNTGVANLATNQFPGQELPTEPAGLPPGESTRAFNTPPLFGIRLTAPFFHDGSAATIREAVHFYDSQEFVASPAGAMVGAVTAANEEHEVDDLVAFLESLVELPVDFSRLLSFGVACPSSPPPATLMASLTNRGESVVHLLALRFTGSNTTDFQIVSDLGDTNLAPGEVRQLEIAFHPTSFGLKEATLEITADNEELGQFSFGMALRGARSDAIGVMNARPLDFGARDIDIGASTNQSIVLSNAGPGELLVLDARLAGSGATNFFGFANGPFGQAPGIFPGILVSEPTRLEVGQQLTFLVFFAPQRQGATSARLRIETTACNEAVTDVALSGTGTSRMTQFGWEPISSPQAPNTPFNVRLTARDHNGDLVQNFIGTAHLSTLAATNNTKPAVVLSEIDSGSIDRVELVNLAGRDVDISGWVLTCYDPEPKRFEFPNLFMPVDTVLTVRENGSSPGGFPDFFLLTNLFWIGGAGNITVTLRNAAGELVDYFTTDIGPIPDGANPGNTWLGAGVLSEAVDSITTYQRVGVADHDDASDWLVAESTPGSKNTALFSFGLTPFGIAKLLPEEVQLVDGSWTGSVTVPIEGSGLRLAASDGIGHSGVSAGIDVIGAVPFVGPLPAQVTTDEDVASPPFTFTIGDVGTPLQRLLLSIRSSNSNLVNNSGALFAGSGEQRTLRLLPVTNQSGSATVTLEVSDGVSVASRSFELIVRPVEDPPFLVFGLSTFVEDFDRTTAPGLPPGWRNESGSTQGRWVVSTTKSQSPFQAAFAPHVTFSDQMSLTSPFLPVPVNGAILEFVQSFDTAPCCDVGFLEISRDDSEFDFRDVVNGTDGVFLEGGYLPGAGWHGNEKRFVRTRLQLPTGANGHRIRLRWRFSNNGGVQPEPGWFIDDIRLGVAPPSAPGLPAIIETDEDEPLVLALIVQDPESPPQDVTLSVTSSNLQLLSASGIAVAGSSARRTVTLTPKSNMFGTADFTLKLSDGSLETLVPVHWTIRPVDDPPVVAPIASFSVTAGTRIDFTVQATNDDGAAPLVFTLDNPPLGAGMETETGRFTWRPTPEQTGLHNLTILVREEDSNIFVIREFQVIVVSLPLQFASVLDFGAQCVGGAPLPPLTLGYTNISTNALLLTQPRFLGSNSSVFRVTADSGQTNLQPGEFRVIQVSYTPTVLGSNVAELELSGSDSLLGAFSAATTLRGRSASSRLFITNVLDFGQADITNFGVNLFTSVSSTGSPVPVVNGPQIVGTNSNEFFIDQLQFDPNTGRLSGVGVRFRPLSRGPKTAFLRLSSDACQNPVVDVLLRGTAISGVDHFAWELGTQATPNIPFPARLLALDRNGERIETFNSSVTVSIVGTQPVLITEIDPGEPDRVEFANVSTQPVNLGGWQVILYDPLPNIRASLVLPSVVLAPGAVFTVTEGGSSAGTFPSFFTTGTLDWFGFSSTIGVMLRNNVGLVADFAATSEGAGITSPIRLPAVEWRSRIVPGLTEGTESYQRIGSNDNNNEQDWDDDTRLNFGVLNPGLVIPFDTHVGPATLRSPTTIVFTNGLWAGSIVISNEAAGVLLAATHASGVAGVSTPIDIRANPPFLSGLPATLTLEEDTELPAVNFTVGDSELAVNRLRVNVRSSNPTLFPRESLTVFGTNSDRQLRGMPATNRAGSASLFIEVSDGAQTVTGRVAVVVRSINDAPIFPTNSSTLNENFDRVSVPALPGGWTSSSFFGGQTWRTVSASIDSAPNAVFLPNAGFSTDTALTSPFFTVPPGTQRLRFRHSFGTESCCDGGFVEVLTGSSFENIASVGGIFISNGYNAGLSWRGNSSGNLTTVIQFPPQLSGKATQLRWRFTTDGSVSGSGWFIDGITFGDNALPLPTTITVAEDTTSPPVIFSVDDVESGPDDLRLSVSSSNPALVPNEGLVLSGSGLTRALTVRPATNQFGTGLILITANDGLTNVSRSLVLNVLPVNDPPEMMPIPDVTVHAGTPFTLPIRATDVDGPLLTYTVGSAEPLPGAQFDPTNNVFAWTPTRADVGRHTVSAIVSDNAFPARSDARTFAINVVDFNVRPLSIALNGVITLNWSAVAGATYRVQFKDDLNAATWNDLPGDVTATGDVATRIDPAPLGSQRWYRIVQLR